MARIVYVSGDVITATVANRWLQRDTEDYIPDNEVIAYGTDSNYSIGYQSTDDKLVIRDEASSADIARFGHGDNIATLAFEHEGLYYYNDFSDDNGLQLADFGIYSTYSIDIDEGLKLTLDSETTATYSKVHLFREHNRTIARETKSWSKKTQLIASVYPYSSSPALQLWVYIGDDFYSAFGFKYTGQKWYGYSCTGGGSTSLVDLNSTAVITDISKLKAVLENGKMSWYIDGVLKGSSTSHIPSNDSYLNYLFNFHGRYTETATVYPTIGEYKMIQAE